MLDLSNSGPLDLVSFGPNHMLLLEGIYLDMFWLLGSLLELQLVVAIAQRISLILLFTKVLTNINIVDWPYQLCDE